MSDLMPDLMIFSGNAIPQLSSKVAGLLGLPLAKSKVGRFSDGETQVSIEEKEIKEEHGIDLLGKVARQIEADAHRGEFEAIQELFLNVPKYDLESFLTDHRSPNEWPDESVQEEAEDCSACNGTGWERVSSDEDERACDDCSGTGKIDEAVIVEKDYRLQAQRETMNLSDQAILELVASLYEKIDNMSEIISNTDPEYHTPLYKRESAQKKRLVDTGLDLKEGPHDKHIFKAIFMAGGPGSGKTFVAKKILKGFHLKYINSDTIYEYLMKKQGMDHSDPDIIYSPAGQATRDRAKELIRVQRTNSLEGKLGLVIDGTGRDEGKQLRLKKMVEDQGYETMMLFVNTSLKVAQERNISRGKKGERQLPAEEVEQMWNAVQHNLMKFQQMFGASNFIILDNSGGLEDPSRSENFTKVENTIRKFLSTEPSNSIARAWLHKNKK